jgi:hypothetical protein
MGREVCVSTSFFNELPIDFFFLANFTRNIPYLSSDCRESDCNINLVLKGMNSLSIFNKTQTSNSSTLNISNNQRQTSYVLSIKGNIISNLCFTGKIRKRYAVEVFN